MSGGRTGPPSAHIEAVDLDGGTIIYDARTDEVVSLNETASAIWRCCDGTMSDCEIVLEIAGQYGVSPTDVEGAVRDILRQFEARRLLQDRTE